MRWERDDVFSNRKFILNMHSLLNKHQPASQDLLPLLISKIFSPFYWNTKERIFSCINKLALHPMIRHFSLFNIHLWLTRRLSQNLLPILNSQVLLTVVGRRGLFISVLTVLEFSLQITQCTGTSRAQILLVNMMQELWGAVCWCKGQCRGPVRQHS